MTPDFALEKAAAQQVEDALGHGALVEAKQASDAEHAQTLGEALRIYRKAIGWSILVSLSVIMEGYDTDLIGNFYAYPSFARKYGHYYAPSNDWQIATAWQTGLGMASTVGAIFGGVMNGQLCARFGYRRVMMVSLVFMAAFIFIVFFATSLPVLLVGEILCGFSWGVFATVGPAYASEVCPTVLRGYLCTYVNLCWAIGQLIAAGVLDGLVNNKGEWAYRIPFAVQWVWPVPLLVGCFLMPESPWYLVRKDRLEEAKHSLRRLSSRSEDAINGQLAMMVHTSRLEAQLEAGARYSDCFRGIDLRRTEIACVAFAGQVLTGSTFAYSPTYFFENAGMDSTQAYKLNVGSTSLYFVGTVLSWWLITYVGRRTIYVWGQFALCCTLLIVGIISAASGSKGALWAQAAFVFLWGLIYSLTLGPVTYSIIAEISSVRLRPLTVCLARTTYQLVNIITQVLEPKFMSPTAWNAKGKTAFFWACTCFLMFLWSFFRLPEPKGRTYEELDLLFQRKIPARQFSSTQIDAYALHSSSQEGLTGQEVPVQETEK
ncbi:hypothetical protein ASPZODRAFT_76719 [Penicilliopsis zonata CBS 506.65]|uniref:Major facilitator superfamily (MFS) profile domain-containing protein n=1 Tax=Penicilliopsis zonata CBS 506.65 TaxID=1073090 RepID=A0A1L9S5L3_9EURO|nr:hypothetical protein ASPZODRAFT_76719 [Penicilliopsis zonata CBS 506.65]OJJ42451.1 hypothetical protein ASPZODRAFT_76719 [Penicilliopsis zonata CBS 506.65]